MDRNPRKHEDRHKFHQRVFRLSGWSRQIHTGLHESGITWDTKNKLLKFRLQGSHLLCQTFPRLSPTLAIYDLLTER